MQRLLHPPTEWSFALYVPKKKRIVVRRSSASQLIGASLFRASLLLARRSCDGQRWGCRSTWATPLRRYQSRIYALCWSSPNWGIFHTSTLLRCSWLLIKLRLLCSSLLSRQGSVNHPQVACVQICVQQTSRHCGRNLIAQSLTIKKGPSSPHESFGCYGFLSFSHSPKTKKARL